MLSIRSSLTRFFYDDVLNHTLTFLYHPQMKLVDMWPTFTQEIENVFMRRSVQEQSELLKVIPEDFLLHLTRSFTAYKTISMLYAVDRVLIPIQLLDRLNGFLSLHHREYIRRTLLVGDMIYTEKFMQYFPDDTGNVVEFVFTQACRVGRYDILTYIIAQNIFENEWIRYLVSISLHDTIFGRQLKVLKFLRNLSQTYGFTKSFDMKCKQWLDHIDENTQYLRDSDFSEIFEWIKNLNNKII